ncbi:tetratricopeptide repeat protein 38-like [Physella acuta]|uniref:tetratricopeptide repeat protein 38-like n=1 Tax=Physella acuta TaxID=109671 RepID=UPI0027DB2AE9|nr:tetratricopeptide repeat protein 38-like [Physella acuta]XP_059154375.1 tetratricopeptide repeat protein 38-like [Physella acuta]
MHSHWRGSLDWIKQGLPLTTASDEACKLYDAIVTQYTGWYDDDSLGGMAGTLEKLRQADPDFVMGQVVQNGLELLGTGRNIRLDQSLSNDVDRMVERSQTVPEVTGREKKHVNALELWANGDMEGAALVWEDILVEHPHDVLALKLAHDTYFYLGNSCQIRDSIARVLPQWKPAMPLYGYVVGMHSFGLEETNLYQEAEAAARKALSINARDAWATHTLCHVMEMMGRQHEGIHMLEKTGQYWKACGMLACHNFWHWALYFIEIGDYDQALSLFDQEVSVRAANSGAMLDVVDVCSLLYRLQMEGVNVGDRWDKVYQVCKPHLRDHVLAFNDMHLVVACLGADQKEAVKELMDSIQDFIRNGKGTNRDVTAEVGETILKAFISYDDGDFRTAIDLIIPVRSKIIKIGGSHAQRDLLNLFLIQAAIKAQDKNLARSLLNERKLLKPSAPMTDRLISKLMEAL